MHQNVIVSFGEGHEFDFRLAPEDLAGRKPDEARKWFAQQFEALECDVPSSIGKLLLVDLILSVAKYGGERRFREQQDWARAFAENAAVLLGRAVVRVDVANYTVGY